MAENITKNSSQSSAAAAAGSKGLTSDQFKVIGFTQEEANKIERPTISYWQDAWRRLRKNPVAMGALVVLGLLVIMVIIGPHIRGYDYINMNVVEKNQGPSGKYWFGTDSLGRDLFSRVWVGARASVIIALVATALKMVIGTLYGAAMAHFGGWVDDIMMRIIEVINSLPNLEDRQAQLKPIKGLMPDPSNLPKGCAFCPRCDYAMEICKTEKPKRVYRNETHYVECHLYNKDNIQEGKVGKR